MELNSERLRLRHWNDEDVDAFAAMGADQQVMRFFPSVLSAAESRALASRIRAGLESRGWGLWAVEARDGDLAGRFLGFTGLAEPRFEAHFTPATEVGWRFAPEAWGRGYATEAARLAVDFAFEQLGLDEIVSFTAVGNAPSRAVMARIGMRRDPAEDFDHPHLPPAHPLRRHVLYRLPANGHVTVA